MLFSGRLFGRLSTAHKHLLCELARGGQLKDHRNVDGDKVYKLHPLDDAATEKVAATLINDLRHAGLIDSNMKFPAATYLLTDKGSALAARLTVAEALPVGTRSYPPKR